MKKVIINALLWTVIMAASLAALDIMRGNEINRFISVCAGAVFFVYKVMMGYAEEMS